MDNIKSQGMFKLRIFYNPFIWILLEKFMIFQRVDEKVCEAYVPAKTRDKPLW